MNRWPLHISWSLSSDGSGLLPLLLQCSQIAAMNLVSRMLEMMGKTINHKWIRLNQNYSDYRTNIIILYSRFMTSLESLVMKVLNQKPDVAGT